MHILLLSRGLWIHSTRRLFEVARGRGHRVRVLDPDACATDFGGAASSPGRGVSHRRAELLHVDCVLPRIGVDQLDSGLGVLAGLEAEGVPSLSSSAAIQLASDKLRSLAALAHAGLPVPRTFAARRGDPLRRRLEDALGTGAVIVKARRGTQGSSVMLAPDASAAASLVQALSDAGVPALAQEYFPETRGRDVRVVVLGNRVLGAMERTAAAGDFRANVHRGGSTRVFDVPDGVRELALRATHTIGLGLAGVDLLHTARGWVLLEVNASPGLQGIEEATELDLATPIVEFLESVPTRREPAPSCEGQSSSEPSSGKGSQPSSSSSSSSS